MPCDEFDPTWPVQGIVFRVDVPPGGGYRFVMAVGDAANRHAHRVIAEAGGTGKPAEINRAKYKSVVLIRNFDQAQWGIGQTDAEAGEGVYARVGFEGYEPPLGDGTPPDPQFVNMNENGEPTGSPFLLDGG